MPENQETNKQLLDVSRNMSEMLKEFKGLNKSLESVSKVFNPEFAKSLKDLLGNDGVLKKISEKIPSLSSEPKTESTAGKFKIPEGLFGGTQGLGQTKASGIKGFFKYGGIANEEGNYVVGENGPEVVSLPKGSAVIPLDVSDLIDGLKNVYQLKKEIADNSVDYEPSTDTILTGNGKYPISELIKSYSQDMTEAQAAGSEGDYQRNSEAVTALSKLYERTSKTASSEGETKSDSSVKSSGPTPDQIEAEKKRLIADDPEFYSDKKNLDSEIDSFINSYNFNEESIKSLGKKENESQKIEEPVKLEEKKKRFGRDKDESEEGEKKEGSGFLSKLRDKKEKGEPKENTEGLSKKIESGVTLLAGTKGASRIAEKIPGFSKISEKAGPGGKASAISAGSKLSAKAIGGIGKREKEPQAEGSLSKSPIELAEKKSAPAPVAENLTSPPQASSPSAQGESGSPAPAKSSSEEKSESGSSSSEKSSSVQSSGGSSSGLGDDVVAIKSLLAQIATNLSGPLNIYNPDPFRPDSRRI